MADEGWTSDPAAFIDRLLPRNERGEPWSLSPYQRRVLSLALRFDARGRLLIRLLLWSEPKKSGKTALAAALAIWWAYTRSHTEVVCLANDQEQAASRVFATVVALMKHNGFERGGVAKILASEIRCKSGSVIRAVASDYRGEAGGRQTLSIFDELWGFDSERATRLWEEHTPIPSAPEAWVLVVTYAGFTGESTLLETLYERGLAGERLDDDLEVFVDRAAAQVTFWSNTPRQPWQTAEYYAQQARSLRPTTFARLHRNEWVSAESTFITPELWDACVDASLGPVAAWDGQVFVGVDGGLKSDTLSAQVVGWEGARLRLVAGRVWRGTKAQPLDLATTIEAWLLALRDRFDVAAVRYDPWQLHRSMSALRAEGLPVEEFAQTEQHTGEMGAALWDLLAERTLLLYPDADLRAHALAAKGIENARGGFRLAKQTAKRKIDAAVALAMACLGALAQGPPAEVRLLNPSPVDALTPAQREVAQRLMQPSALAHLTGTTTLAPAEETAKDEEDESVHDEIARERRERSAAEVAAACARQGYWWPTR